MTWNYISYAGILITLIINIFYFFNRKKYNSGTQTANTILLNQAVSIANYLIIANIIISSVGLLLKHNKLLIHTFDDYLMLMYICGVLIIASSAIGVIGCIFSQISLWKANRELLQAAPNKAKMRFFAQFALFVFGITWSLTDSIITFDWLDYILRILIYQPLQFIPMEGRIYIALLFIIPNIKIFDMINFKYPFKRKTR